MDLEKCRRCQHSNAGVTVCLFWGKRIFEDKEGMMSSCNAFVSRNNYHATIERNLEQLAEMFADGCPPVVKKKCSGNDKERCKQCWCDWFEKDAIAKELNNVDKKKKAE